MHTLVFIYSGINYYIAATKKENPAVNQNFSLHVLHLIPLLPPYKDQTIIANEFSYNDTVVEVLAAALLLPCIVDPGMELLPRVEEVVALISIVELTNSTSYPALANTEDVEFDEDELPVELVAWFNSEITLGASESALVFEKLVNTIIKPVERICTVTVSTAVLFNARCL